IVHLNIDQERARALGLSTADVAGFLASQLTGNRVSQFRDGNELIEILLRGTSEERDQLQHLPSLAIPTGDGRSVALEQVATLEEGSEEGIIWRGDRLPRVTVLADTPGADQSAAVVTQILPSLGSLPEQRPSGYRID